MKDKLLDLMPTIGAIALSLLPLSLLLMLAITGCDKSQPDVLEETTKTLPAEVPNNATSTRTDIRIVEVSGHRFAVAQGDHECAICEVTDASLINPVKR